MPCSWSRRASSSPNTGAWRLGCLFFLLLLQQGQPTAAFSTLSNKIQGSQQTQHALEKLEPPNRLLVPTNAVAPTAEATATPQRSSISIGQAIQDVPKDRPYSASIALIDIATQRIWNVDDPDLPPHYLPQRVHHERRQRWSALWLEQWDQAVGITPSTCDATKRLFSHPTALTRVIRGIAEPMPHTVDRVEKEGLWIERALLSFHRIVGHYHSTEALPRLAPAVVDGVVLLVERLGRLIVDHEEDYSPDRIIVARWATRGLAARIAELDTRLLKSKNLLQPFDERVAHLPFDILPQVVQWKKLLELEDTDTAATKNNSSPSLANHDDTTDPVLSILRDMLPLHHDTITTRTGSEVLERRATAWCTTDPSIGALAYSGKLMPPQPLPLALVEPVLRTVERALPSQTHSDHVHFDAVLCNDYPDAAAACKFHTDPEHGTMWHRTTCVVAAGAVRRFAFRPLSSWGKNAVAAIELFPGDVVHMWGHCNDEYEHAVLVGHSDSNKETGRVSLVLKQALDRGGGRKGHGLPGQGRRGRNKHQRSQRQPGTFSEEGRQSKVVQGGGSRQIQKRTRRSKRRGS